MNKKGFTLMELLAVIVILGIIMVIAVPNLINTRKKAAIEEAKKMEKMLTDLGAQIYTDAKFKKPSGDEFLEYYKEKNNTEFYILSDELKKAGYLKSDLKNPGGGTNCTGYIKFGSDIEGFISCPEGYENEYYISSVCNSKTCLKWENDHWKQ